MPRPAPNPNIVEMIRESLVAMSKNVLDQIGATPEGISESYHDIPLRDGYMSSLKVQKPANGSPGPLVALAYGGGR
jgi:hypothetical protein